MNPLDLRPKQDYSDIQTIGIPQALLYYRYSVMWKTFFEALGRRVIESKPSDRSVLSEGEKVSIDECCLASKLYLGHVASLIDQCDALFIPSVDNLGLHRDFCTKFQALPDLVENSFPRHTLRLISCEVDKLDTGIDAEEAFLEMGLRFGVSKKQVKEAFHTALHAQKKHDDALQQKQTARLKQVEKMPKEERPLRILVAAHPYVIHDPFIGGPITDMLDELEVCTLFADHCDRKRALEKSFEFSETMPWIVNREIIGSILNLYDELDGIVLVSAFPCGPDSMTNDAVVRCIKGKPILSITVDAQSGTAGLETRLESFVDILHYQKRGGYLHG
ncbi:MAG: acyl-CoA dehydratase activase-related protein [Eggerthellaceae bacterium]